MNRGAKTEAKKLMCLLAVLLMAACSGNSVIRRMEQIKTVGNHDPEKALVMLDSLQNAVKSEGEHVGNKYELLRIRLSDKANVMPSSDATIRKLVPYFERVGSHQEKQEQNKAFIQLLHQSELEEKAEDVVYAVRQSSAGKREMTSAEWKRLYQAVDELYPSFKDRILRELGTFTEQQQQVCYLMRIGLSKPQIQNMTNLSRVTVWRWVKKFDWVFEPE